MFNNNIITYQCPLSYTTHIIKKNMAGIICTRSYKQEQFNMRYTTVYMSNNKYSDTICDRTL